MRLRVAKLPPRSEIVSGSRIGAGAGITGASAATAGDAGDDVGAGFTVGGGSGRLAACCWAGAATGYG